MKTNWRGFQVSVVSLALWALNPVPGLAVPLLAQTTFGGSGDEEGTGVAANSSGMYFSGEGVAGVVVGQFSSSLGPSAAWSRPLNDPDSFRGVALTSNGVIAAGRSYANTVDTVGSKEIKGITLKFNADGSAGGGVGGAVWSRQTPAAPGGFPYGGIEWLTGVVAASEGGQTRLYTAGLGQPGFSGDLGRFITKLDDSGNILWSRTDTTTIVHAASSPLWHIEPRIDQATCVFSRR